MCPRNKEIIFSIVFVLGIISTLLLAFAAFGNEATDSTDPSLQLVIIYHRHGERTPTYLYNDDPYKNVEKYWPIGLGQLTTAGIKQLYKLGRTFRKRYGSFISKYNVSTIRVDSSDVDRTIMSAGSLLAGWFPPEGEEVWDKDLLWQPIPIHTIPRDRDKFISFKASCARYTTEQNAVLAELKKNETNEDKEVYAYITNHIGETVNSVSDMEHLHSTLLIEELNNYKLPEWTKKVYPYPIRNMAAISYASFAWNKLMQRLHGGNFINQLLERLKDKANNKNDHKLFLYSGHDISMSVIWRTLGFEEYIIPEFGASLIWELHRFDNDYFIKMFYLNNTVVLEPTLLTIPKCTSLCPLKQLYNITEDVRPVDWEKECAGVMIQGQPMKYNV